MKKFLVVITAVFALSNAMNAQDVEFGVKSGLNISNFAGGEGDRNSRIGFHVGGLAEVKLGEKISLQSELLYSRQGSEIANIVKFELDYLALPIMAKYYVSDKFSIEAGPQMSFLVRDIAVYENPIIPSADTNASNFDFGLNFGLGYGISSNLFIQTRYSHGITTVAENPDIVNSVFQLSLGYKF